MRTFFIPPFALHMAIRRYIRSEKDLLVILFLYYKFTLREIERCFVFIALHLSFDTVQNQHFLFKHLVFYLVVFRIRFPEIFHLLVERRITFSDLKKKTEIEKVGSHGLEYLEFLLLSEDEYNERKDEEGLQRIQGGLHSFMLTEIGRLDLIPFYCSKIARLGIADL